MINTRTIAPPGSTGNGTHLLENLGDAEKIAFALIIEAIGATPTITWTVEGSMDGTKWFPVRYIPDSSETAASGTSAHTTVDTFIRFLLRNDRFWRRYRVVTSLNTNVTYRVEAYWDDAT